MLTWTVAIFIGLIALVAIHDVTQKKHAILRNFPVIGHFRYWLEMIGPELRQYWVASDTEEKPYNRDKRSYVYASSKGENNKIGFGTKQDYNTPGQLHLLPSMFPIPDGQMDDKLDGLVIGPRRRKPYICPWPINISGMSFGALSEEAVRALSTGAMLSNIHILTGEGSLTPYHLEGVLVSNNSLAAKVARACAFFMSFGPKRWRPTVNPRTGAMGGGRIIVQIGPGKFGFRTQSGDLDRSKVQKVAELDQVVAFEIKLAQGAKPGMGGVLPKAKITPEIAQIRGIPMDRDCISPNSWGEFHDVPSLMSFITEMQELTGKPVGFKMVMGDPAFIRGVAQYMKDTGKGPDFITVDGGEGGTGAAPLALADHMGLPILHALPIVDNVLREYGVRDQTVVIASGKIATGADVAIHLAIGADMVNIGRGFLLSLGCIQAMKCHTNTCPTGITTQDKWLRRGLDPTLKCQRVANYAKTLQHELLMLLKSCGVHDPWQLTRHHVSMVVAPGCEKPLAEIEGFKYPPGCDGAIKMPLASDLATSGKPS